jgi:hypothetical protein
MVPEFRSIRQLLAADDGITSLDAPPQEVAVPRWIGAAVANHGKTSAKVKEIAFRICGRDELPSPSNLERDYRNSKRDVLIDLAPVPNIVGTMLRFELSESRGKIAYGRVYYTDIFRDAHSSGFIFEVNANGIVPFHADPVFTSWD